MKKTLFLSIILLSAFLFFLLTGCQKKKKEPFCVTYHVSTFTLFPCKLLISYQDSSKIRTLYWTENQWSAKVCLPPDSIASLVVKPVFDPENNFFYPAPYYEEDENGAGPAIAISISHPKKKVFKTSGKDPMEMVYVSLLQSEIE